MGGGVLPPAPFLVRGAPGKGGLGEKPRRGDERRCPLLLEAGRRPAGGRGPEDGHASGPAGNFSAGVSSASTATQSSRSAGASATARAGSTAGASAGAPCGHAARRGRRGLPRAALAWPPKRDAASRPGREERAAREPPRVEPARTLLFAPSLPAATGATASARHRFKPA